MWPAAIIWLALTGAAFYILILRPQQRRMAVVRQLQEDLREGDEVMTTSGIYGRIVQIDDDDLRVEIATGTVIRLARGAIGQRITSDEGPRET